MPKLKRLTEEQKAAKDRERKQLARANLEFRNSERQHDAKSRATARQDPDRRKADQAISRASHATARQDPDRRKADQACSSSSHAAARQDPDRRKADQACSSSSHAAARQDPDRRKADQAISRASHATARQDPDRRKADQAISRASHATARQDPDRRKADQAISRASHATARQDPDRRKADQAISRASHATARQDPDRRKADQAISRASHATARQDPDRRKADQAISSAAKKKARGNKQNRSAEQRKNTAAHATRRSIPSKRKADQTISRASKRKARGNKQNRSAEQRKDTAAHATRRSIPSKRKAEQTATLTRKRARKSARTYEDLFREYTQHIQNMPSFICSCCGGLWFQESTSKTTKQDLRKKGCSTEYIKTVLQIEQVEHRLCRTCKTSVSRKAVPKMCLANGFDFPPIPEELQNLSPLEERLVALRLPFMQIRALGVQGQSSLKGNVVNVENNLDICCKTIPRRFDQTSTVQVQLMRRMQYKRPYMHKTIRPYYVHRAGRYLIGSELYQSENIVLSDDWSEKGPADEMDFICDEADRNMEVEDPTEETEEPPTRTDNTDTPADGQLSSIGADETLIYSEKDVLDQLRVRIAPAEGNQPLSLFRDANAEVLSFPTIYCGKKRSFRADLKISYTDIAKSELRRYDRRCSRPAKILYSFRKSFNEKVSTAMQVCLRKKAGVNSGFTAASMLDNCFVQSLISKDDGYSIFKNLRSSPAYNKAKTKKVLGMIRQLGKPALFVTFSAAETKWWDLLVGLKWIVKGEKITEEEAKKLTFEEVNELVRSDPVTCMRYFEHRFRGLLNKLLKSFPGIFHPYDLLDFFVRMEFQMRGSPHNHCLFWLKNAPIYVPGDANAEAECVKFIDLFITCERCEDEDVRDYLGFQIHKHSHTCHKGPQGKKRCRFGFPIPPLDVTTILSPLQRDTEKDTLKVIKENYKKIKEKLEGMGRSFTEDVPFEEFLAQVHLTRDEYINAIRSSIKRTTVFLHRSTNAIYINAYNKKLLRAWGANIDIQFIVDPYACAKYCVGYMLKTEGGMSNLLRTADEIRKGNVGTQQKLKKFANILINGSEISAQEAAAFILGIPCTMSSKSDIFINTSLPEERVSILKTKEQLEELDPDSDEVCAKGLLDHYTQRPEDLEELCLAEFASIYDFSTRKQFRQVERTEDDTEPRRQVHEQNTVLQLKDLSGYVKKRRVPKIIRYRHYGQAKDHKNYCREQLMLFVPWRNEAEELLSIDAEQKYNLRIADIEETSRLYIHNKGLQEHVMESLINDIEDEIDEDEAALLDDDLEALEARETYYADVELDLPGRNKTHSCQSENFLSPKMIPTNDFCNLMRSLNDKQRKFVLDILHIVKTNSTPFFRFLSGGAGVGKSHVIFAIVQSIMRFFEKQPQFSPEHAGVLVSAPTGKAAFNVMGMTAHCCFKLPATQYAGRLCDLEESVVNSLRVKLCQVKLFIIDEVSMLSVKQLYQIDQRLRQIYSTNQDFGGKSIIVVGHLRQLPPIGGRYVFLPPSHLALGMCTGNYLWDKFRLFELEEIMRQRGDLAFCKALNNMSEGMMDAEDIQLLKSREISSQLQPNEDAIRLFQNISQCEAYNKIVHERLDTEGYLSVAYDRIQGRGSIEEKERLRESAKSWTLQESDGIPSPSLKPSPYLKVGGEYFVSTNVDVEDGLFNGSTGELKQIEYGYTPKGQKIAVRAYMDFRNPMVGSKARSTHKAHSAINRINLTWTPILRVKRALKKVRNQKMLEVIREQLPLIAANGISVAKAQGSSFFKGAVVRVLNAFRRKLSRELLYTACSRCTSSNGLFIDGTFEPPNPPGPNDPVTIEMARLRGVPYPFVLQFLQDLDDHFETLFYHNVQSIHAHLQDVLADQCCMSANHLAFVEPHLLEQDKIQIPGFAIVHRVNCPSIRNSEGTLVFGKNECLKTIGPVSHSSMKENIGGHFSLTSWAITGVTIVLIYKSPKYPPNLFTQNLSEFIRNKLGNIVVIGDANINIGTSDGSRLVEMFHNLGFQSLLDTERPSTDGGTTIDCCFSNFTNARSWYYESYYSYHKPICVVWPKTSEPDPPI